MNFHPQCTAWKDDHVKVLVNFHSQCTTWKDHHVKVLVNVHLQCTTWKDHHIEVLVNFHLQCTTWKDHHVKVLVNFHPLFMWCRSSSLKVWLNLHTWCIGNEGSFLGVDYSSVFHWYFLLILTKVWLWYTVSMALFHTICILTSFSTGTVVLFLHNTSV